MVFSGDATKHSVKVQKIHRRYSSTRERKRRAGNIVHATIRPSTSQTSANKDSDSRDGNVSSLNGCFIRSTTNFQQKNVFFKANTGTSPFVQRNILTTGLFTPAPSRMTPLTALESNSDNQFDTQIAEVTSDQRGATENYHKDQKKSKKWRAVSLILICALPCLVLTIATVIAVPIVLSQTTTATAQASTTTTTLMSYLTTTCTLTINAVWNTTGTTIQPTFPLLTPRSISFDSSGNMYVADVAMCVVIKYPSCGTVYPIVFAGVSNNCSGGTSNFNGPEGAFLDSLGSLYVPDFYNLRIQKYNSAGVVTTVINSTSIGRPSSIYVTDGTNGPVMYIADQQYAVIRRCVESTGICTIVAQNSISTPTGVFLDSSLNIYVAEFTNYRVTKWTSGNTTAGVIVAGGNGLTNNLNSVQTSGIYVGLLGEIYVPDLSNHRVTRWAVGATAGTLLLGSANGTAGNSSSLLNGPGVVAFDAAHDTYVCDENNHRIQKFNLISC